MKKQPRYGRPEWQDKLLSVAIHVGVYGGAAAAVLAAIAAVVWVVMFAATSAINAAGGFC